MTGRAASPTEQLVEDFAAVHFGAIIVRTAHCIE